MTLTNEDAEQSARALYVMQNAFPLAEKLMPVVREKMKELKLNDDVVLAPALCIMIGELIREQAGEINRFDEGARIITSVLTNVLSNVKTQWQKYHG